LLELLSSNSIAFSICTIIWAAHRFNRNHNGNRVVKRHSTQLYNYSRPYTNLVASSVSLRRMTRLNVSYCPFSLKVKLNICETVRELLSTTAAVVVVHVSWRVSSTVRRGTADVRRTCCAFESPSRRRKSVWNSCEY